MILREIRHQEILRTETQAEDEFFQVASSSAKSMTRAQRRIGIYQKVRDKKRTDYDYPGFDRSTDSMIYAFASDGKPRIFFPCRRDRISEISRDYG